MRINAFRRELTAILGCISVSRTPALRRSMKEDWLYATDLPVLCKGISLPEALVVLAEAGWEYSAEGDWLQLRKTAEEPPEEWFDGPFGQEAACCLSILRRHRERMTEQDTKAAYQLIKAGEEGAEAYEKACTELHGILSDRLRKKQGLPNLSFSYFGERSRR